MSNSYVRRGEDQTLSRNNVKHLKYLISEYELVKAKKHSRYNFAQDFYRAHNLKRQNFIKYYNRYKNSGKEESLLPQKRGPRYNRRKTPGFIEEKVVRLRALGFNRYDICSDLRESLKGFTPSPSTVYNILKKNGLNRLKPKMKKNKRAIIKDYPGQLGHIDCHYLPKGIIESDSNRYYLLAIIDSYSRIAWCEAIKDIKALTVMFGTMSLFHYIKHQYGFRFEELLSDNGPEFGSGTRYDNEDKHPFKRMLKEFEVKQRFIKPYRPQTNGKIERFWRTVNDDLLEDMVFDSFEHLQDEVLKYMVYYNEARNHQAIDGKTPIEMIKKE